MAVTRSRSGKLPQKDEKEDGRKYEEKNVKKNAKKGVRKSVKKVIKKDTPRGKVVKSKLVKVSKSAKAKKKAEKPVKPQKPKQVFEKADGKLQGGVFDDPFQLYAEGLLAESDPRGTEGEPKMPEIPSPLNPFAKYLQLPPAKTLGQRDWPKISYGEFAPMPRWRLRPVITDPKAFDRDNSRDLIKKATGKWEVKGVRPSDDLKFDKEIHKPPMSYDPQVGLGALSWTFEEGDQSAWNGLNRDQLHEYAFRCLWETTKCTFYMQQIANHIRCGFYRDAVKHTPAPVPPLPKPPKEGNFPGLETNVIGNVPPLMTQTTLNFANDPYERDTLAIRPGRTDDDLQPLTRRMFEFKKERIRNAPDIPDGYDDTSSEDDNYDHREGKPAESGNAQPVTGGDGTSEYSEAMEIDDPQEGPSEHRLVGGKAEQPDTENDESAGTASEDDDQTTIPAHLSQIVEDVHDATSYYLACKKIGNDPKQRQKHFPVANAVRRIRTWAGSDPPKDVAKKAKGELVGFSAIKRRFSPPRATPKGESVAVKSESTNAPKKQSTLYGRVSKSGRVIKPASQMQGVPASEHEFGWRCGR